MKKIYSNNTNIDVYIENRLFIQYYSYIALNSETFLHRNPDFKYWLGFSFMLMFCTIHTPLQLPLMKTFYYRVTFTNNHGFFCPKI